MNTNRDDCQVDIISDASPYPHTRYTVRLTHLPTGTVATSLISTTQRKCFQDAYAKLDELLTGPLDALKEDQTQLLREWFHWWQSADGLPSVLPENLHVRTAAYLAATAVHDGRKIFGPRDL